jgi:hypothetical protein
MSFTIPSFSNPLRTQPYANSQSVSQSSQRLGSLPENLETLVRQIQEKQGLSTGLSRVLDNESISEGVYSQKLSEQTGIQQEISKLKEHLAKGILGLPTSEHSAKQEHLIERIKGLQVELNTTEGSKQQSVQARLNSLLKRLANTALAN